MSTPSCRRSPALGAELAERGLFADIYVVGGAAIALAYDERRATRDIDAMASTSDAEVAGRSGPAFAPARWPADVVRTTVGSRQLRDEQGGPPR